MLRTAAELSVQIKRHHQDNAPPALPLPVTGKQDEVTKILTADANDNVWKDVSGDIWEPIRARVLEREEGGDIEIKSLRAQRAGLEQKVTQKQRELRNSRENVKRLKEQREDLAYAIVKLSGAIDRIHDVVNGKSDDHDASEIAGIINGAQVDAHAMIESIELWRRGSDV